MRFSRAAAAGLAAALALSAVCRPAAVAPPILTPEERAWLEAHQPLRFAPDPAFPPIEWIDGTGRYRGLVADTFELIAQRLGLDPGLVAAARSEVNPDELRADKLLDDEEAWIRKGIEARRTRNEGRVRRLEQLRGERAARRERLGRVNLQLASGERSGRMVAELPRLWGRPQGALLGKRVQWRHPEHIEQALAEGKGLILLCRTSNACTAFAGVSRRRAMVIWGEKRRRSGITPAVCTACSTCCCKSKRRALTVMPTHSTRGVGPGGK